MYLLNELKKNTYYDSITLMLLSGSLSSAEGVIRASAMMGTEHNRNIMAKSELLSEETAAQAGPNDLVIGILAENEEKAGECLALVSRILDKNTADAADSTANGENRTAKTLESAEKKYGKANFCVVSVPGRYAANEAMKALRKGMNVLLFSDNVSLEEEVRLKKYAVEHELLLMGPDCGTAWVNGTAFGFANNVRKGDIGIVAASGTGLQEVCVIIDSLGGGISQGLGTGGRDVKEAVGGMMMLMELKALEQDENTKAIGIMGKPPCDKVLSDLIELTATFTKPVVACFLGGNRDMLKGTNIGFADTIEDMAKMLVSLSEGTEFPEDDPAGYDAIVDREMAQFKPEQKYIRGLYSGGSLCYEGILQCEAEVGHVYSNISSGEYCLSDPEQSVGNTFLDMGEDYFTDGMPHPMIDTRQRVARIKKEAADASVAVMVFDCVLGYGSNADPAGAISEAVKEAKIISGDRHITYIASCCGTYTDFQNRAEQEKKMRDAGIIVVSCNAQAAKLAAKFAKRLEEKQK